MTQEQVERSVTALFERVTRQFHAGEIGICDAAERAIAIFQWGADRVEYAQVRETIDG